MPIPFPDDVRAFFAALNYVELTTLQAGGAGQLGRAVELWGDHTVLGRSDAVCKTMDARRDPRVDLSVADPVPGGDGSEPGDRGAADEGCR